MGIHLLMFTHSTLSKATTSGNCCHKCDMMPEDFCVTGSLIVLDFCAEPKFPKDYPTGCLLGCVNVTDCLSQEQFRQQVSETLHHTRIQLLTAALNFKPGMLCYVAIYPHVVDLIFLGWVFGCSVIQVQVDLTKQKTWVLLLIDLVDC